MKQQQPLSTNNSFENFLVDLQEKSFEIKGQALRDLKDQAFLNAHPHFRMKPVSFKKFVESPLYLDEGENMYKAIKEIGNQISKSQYNEILIEAGLGSGKSYLASVLTCYIAHLLLCLRNPHQFFKITNDKPITCLNMSITATHARKVVFSAIRHFVKRSPWFQRIPSKILKGSIEFEDGSIELVCGNSSETSAIGVNLYASILDEVNFFIDGDEKSNAEEIFDMLRTRTTSRFGNKGISVAISSSLHDEDFLSKKYKELKEKPDDKVFYIRVPTWKAKDRDRMNKDAFIFDSKKFCIIQPEDYKKDYDIDGKNYKLALNEEHKKDLKFKSDVLNSRFWIIPKDFYQIFKRNPEAASRDLGARASMKEDLFIKIPHFVDKAFGNHFNFCKNDKWVFPEKSITEEPLYMHIDMGLNRETKSGEGDACGIAVGYFDGYDEKSEGRPMINICGLQRMLRSDLTGEVNFKDVRAIVFALANASYEFDKVTIDGWQSADTIQTLNNQGIECEILSIDRTVEPYESYKEALYEQRIKIPHHEIAIRETKQLQVIKGKKIDHQKKGSKDLSDAIAGVCYNILMNYGVGSEGGGLI